MSSPPPDDLDVIGGVWVGSDPAPPPPPAARPRPPRRGPVLVGGAAVVLAGGAAGFATKPHPLGPALGVAVGLALSGLAYLMLTRPPRVPEPPRPTPAPSAPPPAEPMPVVYKPAPRPPSAKQREADELADQLMRMCHEDEKLFDRLVAYERSKHPRLARRELIRLAIEHFWQNHR